MQLTHLAGKCRQDLLPPRNHPAPSYCIHNGNNPHCDILITAGTWNMLKPPSLPHQSCIQLKEVRIEVSSFPLPVALKLPSGPSSGAKDPDAFIVRTICLRVALLLTTAAAELIKKMSRSTRSECNSDMEKRHWSLKRESWKRKWQTHFVSSSEVRSLMAV